VAAANRVAVGLNIVCSVCVCKWCGRSRVSSVVERSKKGLNAVAVEHLISVAEVGRARHASSRGIDVTITCDHVVSAWLHWQTPKSKG
jgi:hypothetical protein